MKFHIPKQDKPVKERVDVRLERGLLKLLDQYCRYMESDRDYVIATVLGVVLKKDKGFTDWRRAQGADSGGAPQATTSTREARA